MTESQRDGKQDEGLVERLTKVASLGKEDFHGLPLLTLAVTSVAAQAAARIEELEREVVRLAKDVEELSAPSAERTSELEAANVGLADEAARMRMALSELVDAGSAFDNRDDMSAAEEQAAEKRWLVALKEARPFTEAALLAPAPASGSGEGCAAEREPASEFVLRKAWVHAYTSLGCDHNTAQIMVQAEIDAYLSAPSATAPTATPPSDAGKKGD